MKKVFVVISCLILFASIGVCIYVLKENNQMNHELTELQENITKVKEKISNSETEKETKQNQYEKLEKETKEKMEEFNIWKETKEKLEQLLL